MKFCYCPKCGKYEENNHHNTWFHCDCEEPKRDKHWIDKVIKRLDEKEKKDE